MAAEGFLSFAADVLRALQRSLATCCAADLAPFPVLHAQERGVKAGLEHLIPIIQAQALDGDMRGGRGRQGREPAAAECCLK